MDIGQFFIKYWLEWVFGLIASGILVGARFYVRAKKKEWKDEFLAEEEKAKAEVIIKLEKEIEEVRTESTAADSKMDAELECLSLAVENLTQGILSIQGKQFKEQCREYLQPGVIISVEDFEQLTEDHDAYNALGGNHKGDTLFESVKIKFNAQNTK